MLLFLQWQQVTCDLIGMPLFKENNVYYVFSFNNYIIVDNLKQN